MDSMSGPFFRECRTESSALTSFLTFYNMNESSFNKGTRGALIAKRWTYLWRNSIQKWTGPWQLNWLCRGDEHN